jgi:hypothetical protein
MVVSRLEQHIWYGRLGDALLIGAFKPGDVGCIALLNLGIAPPGASRVRARDIFSTVTDASASGLKGSEVIKNFNRFKIKGSLQGDTINAGR